MHFNSTKQERMIFRESYTVLVAFLETISHCLLIESQSCWCFKSNLVMIMLFFWWVTFHSLLQNPHLQWNPTHLLAIYAHFRMVKPC